MIYLVYKSKEVSILVLTIKTMRSILENYIDTSNISDNEILDITYDLEGIELSESNIMEVVDIIINKGDGLNE